jgi:RNA polymerase-binding transcription factor DksA
VRQPTNSIDFVPRVARVLHVFSNMASMRVGTLSILSARRTVLTPRQRQVHAALTRIENGTFGICTTCSRPVERERLDSAPLTEQCGPCAAAQFESARRPA